MINKLSSFWINQYRKYFHDFFSKIGLSFFINITGALIAFCQQFFFTNIMGSTYYGEYVYVSTWILILSFIPRLGLDTCLLKYLAEYRANHQWNFFFGILKKAHHCTRIISSVVVCITITLLGIFKEETSPELATVFLIGSFAIPFTASSRLYQATLQSTQNAIHALVYSLLFFPVCMCTLVALLYYSGFSVQSVHVMLSHVAALTVTNIIMMHLSRNAIRTNYPFVAEIRYKTKEWLKVAFPIFFISFLQLLLTRLDIIMVGWLLDTQQAGLYAISSLAASTVVFGISSAHVIVAPQISYLYHKKDMHGLQKTLQKEMRMVCLMTFPLIAVLILLGKPILTIFGTAFLPGYPALAILLLGQSFTAFMGSISFLMIVGGYQLISAYFIFSCVVINILLNLLFIPLYGIQGAAWANTLTMIIWHLCMYFFVKKRFEVDTTALSILK